MCNEYVKNGYNSVCVTNMLKNRQNHTDNKDPILGKNQLAIHICFS